MESETINEFGKKLRREKYAGDWREGLKEGFGILEVEHFAIPETDEFPTTMHHDNVGDATRCYEGCWKDGVYDGWV